MKLLYLKKTVAVLELNTFAFDYKLAGKEIDRFCSPRTAVLALAYDYDSSQKLLHVGWAICSPKDIFFRKEGQNKAEGRCRSAAVNYIVHPNLPRRTTIHSVAPEEDMRSRALMVLADEKAPKWSYLDNLLDAFQPNGIE